MTNAIFTFAKPSIPSEVLKTAQVLAVFFTLIWSGGAMADNNLRIKECPESPNCVSSLSSADRSKIDPLKYGGSIDEARSSLKSILASMRGAAIIQDQFEYIHATFTSAIFGFVDDVEFVFDDVRKIIDFRSASRTGYYDFGVNRRRMESISKAFGDTQEKGTKEHK